MPGDRSDRTREQSSTVSRRLLSKIRAIMAGTGGGQQRLDQVVRIIAAEMVAEVCSVYLRIDGDVLELYATEGLKAEAVHKTHLDIGEGLVGDIAAHARPLALADAQSHPKFAYRPETGEEIFHSLMGVPVIRAGRVRGVIVVQNKTQRHYSEEEIESLETIAMVMAEMIAGGEFGGGARPGSIDASSTQPMRFEGLGLNGGLGMGEAVLHRSRVTIEQMVSDDPKTERSRLDTAYAEMHGALDNLMNGASLSEDGEHREILEAYRMIASDAGWMTRIGEAIDTGLTAEAAVEKVQNDLRARMSQVNDPYLRERVHDIEDLGDRLLRHLVGEASVNLDELPEDIVLVARNLGPAQLFDYGPERLRALVLEEGSPTSHAAIVARALEIPVVANVEGALDEINRGDPVIVDGESARVYVRPGEDIRKTFLEAAQQKTALVKSHQALRDKPAVSVDGVDVSLMINAGLIFDMHRLDEVGADGVGLYRTEVPFMVRPRLPGLDEQYDIYKEVLAAAGDKQVVFRTLDVGGDKALPYWSPGKEENPALGWRSIRISLDRPAVFRRQLRALIRASAGRPLDVMFPMIANVEEFVSARGLLDAELRRHAETGSDGPTVVRAGCMLEVPGLVFQLPALLRHVDFLSVGSNDLMQFLFASDRGNTRLLGRYDTLSPAMIRVLRQVVGDCAAADKSVSLCGEMAGNPLDALILVGIGFRTISMTPARLPAVKAMIRSLDVGALRAFIDGLIESDAASVRDEVRAYAEANGISL
ncbi:MAG: phosphoenolpyruvate--protein phosphotransferase [Rhodospirillales bacterium]